MDYLNIIATRSLVLFPNTAPTPTKPTHYRTFSDSSDSSVKTASSTPTSLLPRPGPVAMPIHSLMSSDTDCAYYLLTHVLTHPAMFPAAIGLLGGVTKEVSTEAEIMVWTEIDKAKMFIRTLGEWYANHPEGITESQCSKLAKGLGLAWKTDDEVEKDSGDIIEEESYGDIAVVA